MAKSLEKTVVRVFGAGAGLVFSAVLWINSNFFCNSCLTSVRRRRPTRLTQTLGFLLSSFPPTFAFFSSFANFRSVVGAKQIDIMAQAGEAA